MFENVLVLRFKFSYFYKMKFEDTFKHKGMRRQLIAELRKDSRITDERIFEAFFNVPRHLFLDKAFVEQAYSNMAFQIGAGQTISHPITVAFQTQLLEIQKGDKILEIGTGSGFQTCILCEMGAKVYSIERQKLLFDTSKKMLAEMGYKCHLAYGDGYKGIPAFAPYDRIIITCAIPIVPEELLMQLKPGGKLVMPFGEGEKQEMTLIQEDADGNFQNTYYGEFSFVPMLEKRSNTKS
jgi:protein-L-isoaspartate(D-aspartate) O-methyltransferase